MRIIKCYIYISIYLLLLSATLSQNLADTSVVVDTTSSVNITDNVAQDSVKEQAVMYSINNTQGSILVDCDSIPFRKFPTINYFATTEIIATEFAVTPLFTTLLGNNSNFAYMGTYNNTLMLNNVSMVDFCSINSYDIVSPEFANKMEVLSGSMAAVIAGTAGLAVNMQPSIFDTQKPYTRIWYAQGDNKLIGIDGTYSQNFAPNWNITAGFKHLTSNSFYQNSFFDMWNARAMLNYRLSNLSSMTFIYHFYNYNTGDFGGINFEDYNTNDNSINQVRSNFADLSDRQYKTDCIVAYNTTLKDSSLTINSNLFWNHTENNLFFYEEPTLLELDSTGRNTSSAVNYGLNTTLKYNFSTTLFLNSGFEFAYNNIPTSLLTSSYSGVGTNLFANLFANLAVVNVSFGGRIGRKYDENIYAIGTNIDTKLSPNLNIFADISYLKTSPNPIFDFKNEKHLLAIIGSKYKTEKNDFSLNLYYRNINNPILLAFDKEYLHTFTPSFINVGKQDMLGITGDVLIKLPLNFETQLLISDYLELSSNNSDNKYANNLYASWLLQYTYTKSTSSVTFGVKTAISLNTNKLYYNPLFRHYSVSDLSEQAEYDGITAYIIAKLGNCHLRASFRNILGTNFSYLAYYPILKQEFCLSLTWAFPL